MKSRRERLNYVFAALGVFIQLVVTSVFGVPPSIGSIGMGAIGGVTAGEGVGDIGMGAIGGATTTPSKPATVIPETPGHLPAEPKASPAEPPPKEEAPVRTDGDDGVCRGARCDKPTVVKSGSVTAAISAAPAGAKPASPTDVSRVNPAVFGKRTATVGAAATL